MTADWREAANALRDADAALALRIRAAEELGTWGNAEVLPELVELASDKRLDSALSHAIGVCLARISWREGKVLDAALADVTGNAYQGFDDTISQLQHQGDELGGNG